MSLLCKQFYTDFDLIATENTVNARKQFRNCMLIIVVIKVDRCGPRALEKDAPESRAIQSPALGKVVELPQVGGLHHRYERRAA
jgi:hypothetical protein